MLGNQGSDGGRRTSLHGHWSSRMAFVLAVTGSAVGLGNVWKFPYVAGENGGGAFVLVYLLCVVLIGMPVMMSEILIGRRGRRNPIATMELLGREEGSSGRWKWVGGIGVVAGIFILSYYSVVAGWVLAYVPKSMSGVFTGATAAEVQSVFSQFTGSWWQVGLAHTIFMGLTIFVVARGVERGLEQAVRFMVPALILLMLLLLVYAIKEGAFMKGADFLLLSPRWEDLTWTSVLKALGQAFFTLSVGMGAIMAFGAYLPEETSITGASGAVVAADTCIALLAGLVIFPLVFAHDGLEAGAGEGLVFETLPLAFGSMNGGVVFSTVFFVLLAFAAWTSALGLVEPAVAWLVERYHKTRAQAAVIIGSIVWFIGLGSVFSFNLLQDFRFLVRVDTDGDGVKDAHGTIFNNVDYLTSNVMLPLGGLLITVFAGWVMCRNSTADELGGAGTMYRVWRVLARFVAPIAILIVLINTVLS